jgi:proline iminopeptidase
MVLHSVNHNDRLRNEQIIVGEIPPVVLAYEEGCSRIGNAIVMRHRLKKFLAAFVVAATFLHLTSAAAGLVPHEGFVQVPGGPVWYRVFGSGTATPLIIVHGGPGMSSCIFDPLATLVSQYRPVVVYDQLGSGRSGRPMDSSLWNAERSVRELAAIRKALGLRKVHLMGHSWGASVVADYIITVRPSGVESVVLAGPLLSTKLWIEDANLLRAQLPADVQEVLRRNEQAGTVQSKEYEAATNVFYGRFLYHQAEVKKPESCAQAPPNEAIYQIMWGPTEFYATGNLSTFDVTPGLKQLTMPTMFTVGRYDEARLETVAKFQAMIPGSIVKVLENSGHMAPLEEYQAYSVILEGFLREVDNRSGRPSSAESKHKTN